MVGLWVDVFDSNGNRLGDGPVDTIRSVNVRRQFDGAGIFTISAVVSSRSIELLNNENRVKIYNEDANGAIRLVGQGIIEKRDVIESPSGIVLRVTGPDILDELTRKNVLLVRIFNQKTIQTVASELISLVPGWSVVVDSSIASNLVDARYDGTSVLKAFRDLVNRYGYHFRLSSSDKIVTISQFGQDSGLRVFKTEVITQAMIRDPKLLFLQRLPQSTETGQLANWIIPLGAGEGTAGLTLEKSTRTSPYAIQSITGPDGDLLYYLADATSIATYGQIETIKTFKQIAALTNSETDIINAANALYDASAEWLTRNKDPIINYGLTVKNVKENILPGDKIHVNYKGQIITPRGEIVDYLSVRDDFWVIKATEAIGLDSHSVELEISNIDQRVNTVAEAVAESMENITLRGLKPEISSTTRSYVYDREIAAIGAYTAVIPIEFTDATLKLERVRFRLKTTPFRATSKGAAAGGDHRHKVGNWVSTGDLSNEITRYVVAGDSGGASNFSLFIKTLSTDPNNDIYTFDSSGDHTHNSVFGITDDTLSPKNVTVFVNGVDKTTELFGSTPLAPTGANLDVVADAAVLTGLIANAAGGLRQEHTIEIKCADQQGRVEATVEIFEVNQSVKIV
jgi:hypothetical protein